MWITELALTARQKEALLNACIDTTEFAREIGQRLVVRWLERTKPSLTTHEISECLRVLFHGD